MKLSENFTLEEIYRSTTAAKYGIDNYPHSTMIMDNINSLVNTILQPIRDAYGKAITVTSGYRCKELNAKVGGSATSQHMLGQAADIKCSDNRVLFDLIVRMIEQKQIVCGQLIWEYGNSNRPDWVHISLPSMKNRNSILRAIRCSNGKTRYVQYK